MPISGAGGPVARRAELADEWGLTSRTLDRFELEGARLLDEQIRLRQGEGEVLRAIGELDMAVLALMQLGVRYPVPESHLAKVQEALNEPHREPRKSEIELSEVDVMTGWNQPGS